MKKLKLEAWTGLPLGQGIIALEDWNELKTQGWYGFRIVWEHEPGHIIRPPVFEGIWSQGGKHISEWADVVFHYRGQCAECKRNLEISEEQWINLFRRWARIISWNGHIHVAYEMDEHHETHMGLKRGFPPACTPIGYAGYFGGFIGGFKDWYIAEGGNEGPKKLQMNKPLNLEHAQKVYESTKKEIAHFLESYADRKESDSFLHNALKRAREWLEKSPEFLKSFFT